MLISNSFSDSVSPAFLIRVGAAMEYSGSGEEEEDGKVLISYLFRFLFFTFEGEHLRGDQGEGGRQPEPGDRIAKVFNVITRGVNDVEHGNDQV